MKLLVAIPALNEELSIVEVIVTTQKNLPEAKILVIDDGSTDRTAQFARSTGATVISLPFNVGVGGALRVAFKFALENGIDQVLQIDADGQHLPEEARKLFNASTSDSLVIGSRFLSKKSTYKVGLSRKFAMRLLATVTSLICRTKLTDVTSGFRLTSGKAIEIFASEYPREYLGDTVESLIIAHTHGIEIREVSVTMNQRLSGNPSQNLIKSIWYLSRALLVIFLTIVRSKSK